jgi:hypothetical protein
MIDEFHKCTKFDYCILSDSEYLLFCTECKKAGGIVEFKVRDNAKRRYDDKLLEDLK